MLHNLLTPSQRKRLRSEYRLRLATVTLVAMTCALVLGIVALLPTYTYLDSQLDAMLEEEMSYRNADGELATAARDTLRSTADVVTVLGDALRVEQATALIDAVQAVQPDGVFLTGYRYSVNTGDLTVEGVAAERRDLITYIENLEQHERFEDVPTPISNLAQNADLPFMLSFPVVPVGTDF